MVDRNLINQLGLSDELIDEQINEMFGETEHEHLENMLQMKVDSKLPGTILKGIIAQQIGSDVIVEVGLKSEGKVDVGEFGDP
jgi:small subunit ribosomal protein S1